MAEPIAETAGRRPPHPPRDEEEAQGNAASAPAALPFSPEAVQGLAVRQLRTGVGGLHAQIGLAHVAPPADETPVEAALNLAALRRASGGEVGPGADRRSEKAEPRPAGQKAVDAQRKSPAAVTQEASPSASSDETAATPPPAAPETVPPPEAAGSPETDNAASDGGRTSSSSPQADGPAATAAAAPPGEGDKAAPAARPATPEQTPALPVKDEAAVATLHGESGGCEMIHGEDGDTLILLDDQGQPGDWSVEWSADGKSGAAYDDGGRIAWTVEFSRGKAYPVGAAEETVVLLSAKAAGTVTFDDGTEMRFKDLRRLSW